MLLKEIKESDHSLRRKFSISPDVISTIYSAHQMDLIGVFSLSQTADNFGDAYKEPLDNETLRLGIQVPIADWGKNKARLETAFSVFIY